MQMKNQTGNKQYLIISADALSHPVSGHHEITLQKQTAMKVYQITKGSAGQFTEIDDTRPRLRETQESQLGYWARAGQGCVQGRARISFDRNQNQCSG